MCWASPVPLEFPAVPISILKLQKTVCGSIRCNISPVTCRPGKAIAYPALPLHTMEREGGFYDWYDCLDSGGAEETGRNGTPGHGYVVPLCTDPQRPPDAGVDAAAQDPVGGGETASIGNQTGGAAGGLSLAGLAGKEGLRTVETTGLAPPPGRRVDPGSVGGPGMAGTQVRYPLKR